MKRLTDEDFNLLLPGETIKLGKSEILIKPVPPFSDEFKLLYLRVKELKDMFSDKGITFQNFPFKLPEISEILLDCPDILSLLSDIHEDDLKRLPIKKLQELIETVIKVNSDSYEGMEKNLNTWMEIGGKMLRGGTLILSLFSSGEGIKEPKSKPIPLEKLGVISEPKSITNQETTKAITSA